MKNLIKEKSNEKTNSIYIDIKDKDNKIIEKAFILSFNLLAEYTKVIPD